MSFTTWAESQDAEAVRELLSRYFEVASVVVRRHGGVVEKFIGDAVMAVWGSPVATEDDPERAVRAALDLVESIGQLGVDAGIGGLAGRAGVVSGEVAVNLAAVNEGMVAGDAVNTAARIQSAAAPGSVWVDGATRRLTANAISYHDEGAHTLKGKAEPEHLWRAVRVVSSVGGVQRVDGLEAPLTGRGAEMRALRELFHASAERRVPRLVVVSGPAGVGKSRLGWEFEKYVDGLADGVWWHRGRCLSYGDGLVYWALAEVIRQRLGIAEDDDAMTVAAKLRDGLARYVGSEPDREFIGVRIGRLLGVGADGGDGSVVLSREELFAGCRRFFEELAAVQPVAILIEDAHHASADLLDFVEHLIDWVRDLPVFVLVFTRPQIAERRPGFGSGPNRASITLDPLDGDSMDELVDALIADIPTADRALIVSRAQGIPLYAVETIRALIDRDVVRPVEGRYRLVGGIGELGVPDSLHALLAARLDALDVVARRVVADAAVLGSTFPAEAIGAISGLDETACAVVLGELLRREVLLVSADPLSPEHGSYRFAQDMLRQVAYDTMSRRDRKARHLAVAAHLRASFPGDGEEVLDAVARHYVDALDAVPDDDDVDDVRRAAIDVLTRAGERAIRTGSPRRAATCYRDAAELAEASGGDRGRAARLRLDAAEAANRLSSSLEEVTVDAERAREIFAELDDTGGVARAMIQLGRALRRAGRNDHARLILTEAIELLGAAAAHDRLDALDELAMAAAYAGVDDADQLSASALALGQQLDVDDRRYAKLLGTRSMYLLFGGEPRLAAMFAREAARLSELNDNALEAGYAYLNLANIHIDDHPAEGLDAARRGIDIMSRLGHTYALDAAVINMAWLQLALGSWQQADELLSSGPHAELLVDDDYLLATRVVLAGLRGDTTTATDLHARIQLADSDNLEDQAYIAMAGAFEAAARSDHDQALRLATAGIEHLGTGIRFGGEYATWTWPLAARTAHELARFDIEAMLADRCSDLAPGAVPIMHRAELALIRARLAAAGDDAGATAQFADALAMLREHSTPYHLAQGLLDNAEHLHHHDDTNVAEYINEALSIAEHLDCPPLTHRAQRLRTTTTPLPA